MYVFVDECHRTQGGILNRAMKKIMGENVMLIGFTGTPLLRSQKQKLTSRENFGNYIHTYKFNEAVDDKVVLDLRYEARDVEQSLDNKEALDALFNHISAPLSQKAKDELQKHWAVMSQLFSSRDRIEKIVADIIKDMTLIPCLRDGWGNAMLVCDSIYQAYRYWEALQHTFLRGHCAVVSSFDGKDVNPDESSSGETESEAEYKAAQAKLMFGNKNSEDFEAWAKNEFIKHPGSMKLLIVVNKLLTGFDAPSATYLYLDKKMEGQDLFQAICRVNRPNDEQEDKEFGYIVDFKKLFKNIENAVSDYTDGAFKEFDKEEVEGLLTDRFENAKRDLDVALERVEKLCEPVVLPRTIDKFFDYFVFPVASTAPDEEEATTIKTAPKREQFYSAVRILVTRYSAIALDMGKAGYTEEEAKQIFSKVKNFSNIRDAIMRRAGDLIDMKRYDQQMRQILDTYVEAKHSKVLMSLDDLSFLDLVLNGNSEEEESEAEEELGGKDGVASTITANVRRVINRKKDSNPEEYRKFSERINRLLEEYRQGVLEYKGYLKAVAELARELRNRTTDTRLDSPAKQTFFDNLGEDVEFALEVYTLVKNEAKIGFKTSQKKQGKLRRALESLAIEHEFNVETIFNIIMNQPEFS